jgi:hypothetical protein
MRTFLLCLFINAISFFSSFEVNNRKPFICLYTYLTCPYLSEIDLIIPPLFLLLIFLLNGAGTGEKGDCTVLQILPARFIKLFAGIGVCLIYAWCYSGGDTLNYFYDYTCITESN